ncbi:MAG: MEMO1 family protein [Candidatus Anstonellaceae archaeon]
MRYPAVAGSFYPSSAHQLRQMVKGFLAEAEVKSSQRLAIVCPHAGYIYSGKCAAYSYAACSNWSKKNLSVVVIGPNHTGLGLPISVSFEDWQTPLGTVGCDVELAQAIVSCSKIARKDEQAHFYEHSCEVQLPFLQLCAPSCKFVSICMGWQDLPSSQELGKAIFEAAQKTKKNIIVVASSDFTHYESAKLAESKDMKAIKFLLSLDEAGFQNIVEKEDLSICGHGPIAAALHYAKCAGAKKCELLKYTNSGEASGDFESVVAYASLAIS